MDSGVLRSDAGHNINFFCVREEFSLNERHHPIKILPTKMYIHVTAIRLLMILTSEH